MKWRVGGKVPLNVYEDDRPMFQCHTPEDATRVVLLLNGQEEAGKLIADSESMGRLIADLREALDEKPIGWVCKVIVNKHVSGPPLEGQIKMGNVWGTPTDHIYFSIERPLDKWAYWEAPVYVRAAISRTAKQENL